MVSNEVFVGAGQSVTFVPETTIYLADCSNATGTTYTIIDSWNGDISLVPKLYVGCMAKVELTNGTLVGTFMIADNTSTSLTFNESIHGSDLSNLDVTILSYGAPTPSVVTLDTLGATNTGSSTTGADASAIATITITDAGASGTNSTGYTNIALEGSLTGSGAFATIVVGSGAITGVTITKGGDGYVVGETLSLVTSSGFGGGSNPSGIPTLDASNSSNNATLTVASIATHGHTVLSDSWLGLVGTFTAPSVEVTLNQMNLALGGTRNFTHQYKGAETVSGASFDVSLNNGSWLYYALGNMTVSELATAGSSLATASTAKTFIDRNTGEMVRTVLGSVSSSTGGAMMICPPVKSTSNFTQRLSTDLSYTFTELNGDSLPSFAIDMTHTKANNSDKVDNLSSTPNSAHENMWAKLVTGCQVNTLTMNFAEGEEVKANVDLVSKTLFDCPPLYYPQRNVSTVSELHNFGTTVENYPFMFSDGGIKIFGQTFSKIKSGSVVITNNLTPHRFIGNYDKRSISHHTPAQRTYDLSFTMLITDTRVWEELRRSDEFDASGAGVPSNGVVQIKFSKPTTTAHGGSATEETIDLQFSNYIVDSVTFPFPEDKGVLEVEVTMKARTLTSATYVGSWEIINTK
tara:strand:+ start:723 stop:2624 length:1902 start_codon:yes stop_codon:yes gene_type:complete